MSESKASDEATHRAGRVTPSTRPSDPIKRALDVVGAGLGLLATAPIQLVVAVLVRRRLGNPVLFRQERPGLGGRSFTILKFRTMLDADPDRGLVTNEERLTPFGARLRAASLDELPSLWNVLRGDMSLVGPRPLRIAYLARYSARQARRHEVRPGLTGLAQVSGRNTATWAQRLELDVQYVDNRTLWLDLQILARTLIKVLRRDGIVQEGQASKEAFTGQGATSLRAEPLSPAHLPTRVRWLSDPRVAEGITLTFTPNLRDTEEWFAKIAEDASRHDYVVADEDGVPAAMFGLQSPDGRTASWYVFVDPDRHGQGVGRATISLVVDKARELGIRVLTLETKAGNGRARALYRSFGFRETSVGPRIAMMLDLAEGGHG